MMQRWFLSSFLILIGMSLLCGGCGSEAGKEGRGADGTRDTAPGENAIRDGRSPEAQALYTMRNQAKLEADRNSDEGSQAAIALLEELLAEAPNGFTDRLNLARVLVFTDRAEEAGAQLQAARALLGEEPAPPELEYVEGLLANRLQDQESALSHFTRATTLLPSHIQCWYQRGYAEERLGRFDEAATSYAKVLTLDPENRAAAYRQVIVLRQLERAAEADVAFAHFQTLPQEGQPDPEKCDLTRVSLVPMARQTAEPPVAEVEWIDVTDLYGGAFSGLHAVNEWTAPNQIDVELAMLDDGGVLLQRVQVGGAVSGRNVFPAATGRGARDLRMADVDNDGFSDLIIVGQDRIDLWLGREDGRFQPAPLAIPNPLPTRHLELWDLDHDGDLDIVALVNDSKQRRTNPAEGPLVWWRNNGDRKFEASVPVTLEGLGDPKTAAARPTEAVGRARIATLDAVDFSLHDLDQGNDIDLVVTGPRGTVALMNLRNGQFRPILLEAVGALSLVRLEDFNNDGAPDLFGVLNSGGGSRTEDAAALAEGTGARWVRALGADREGRIADFRLSSLLAGAFPEEVRDLVIEDLDNDGDADLLYASGDGIGWMRNHDGGSFELAPGFVVGDQAAVHSVDTTDADDDGSPEVWIGSRLGSRVVEAQNSKGYGAWRVRPKGARDNRDAVGLVVQQFAGTAFQSRIVRGSRGLRLGLVEKEPTTIDGLRLRWPQGIVQSETQAELIMNTPHEFRPTQDEGLVASCPFLYADGPEGWTFLTDVVGIAPLDEWLPSGVEAHFDPEEYVRIEGKALRIEDGTVRLAITEELRETTYLDRVELVVVQHPLNVSLYLDESSRQGTYDPLRVYALQTDSLQPPLDVQIEAGAIGSSHGAVTAESATALVSLVDGRYLHGYAPAPSQWSGWVERYGIDLVAPPGAEAMLLTGRIGWYDSSVSYALDQQGRTWGPLRLEEEGRVLIEDLGVPAGMDRTMVALLGNASAERRHLRLSGQHRFLWDRIAFTSAPEFLDLGEGDREVSLADGREVVARIATRAGAELGYHGFSPMAGNRPLHEQTYDFGSARPDGSYDSAWGPATRYGDVLPLLAEHDDELVVLLAGDRAVLEFTLPVDSTAADPRGLTYFLRVTGWAKEGSFHNATGRWIEPLPYRGMDGYPPSGSKVADADYDRYLETYQTRIVRSE